MAMKTKRPGRALRVADQIARDLAELIPQNVRDPRVGLVTVTGCEITPDYAHAKVFFTALGCDETACREGLNAAAGCFVISFSANSPFTRYRRCISFRTKAWLAVLRWIG